MAWTKTKTAVALVCTVGCIWAFRTFRSERTAPPPDIQGTWQGVDFGKRYKGRAIQHSRVVLKLYETNGVYSTTWDYIDLERTNAWRDVIRDVVYKFPKLRFDEEPWGTRNAIINNDGSIMTIGSGDDLMVMERTRNPDVVPEWLSESEYTPRVGSGLQGCWRGGATNYPLIWKISDPVGGGRRGEFEIPRVGARHWLVSVVYDPPSVKLKLMNGQGLFRGTINGSEITGSFGSANVLTFKRVDRESEEFPPENDYLFDSRSDLQGHWKADLPIKLGELGRQPRDLEIARLPDGSFRAAMARPLLIGFDGPIKASEFHHESTQVHLGWKPLDVTFDGKLADGKLMGKWTEEGETYRVTFERSQ